VFKSVDGLYTERSDGEFSLKVDKTHSTDPLQQLSALAALLEQLKQQ
jgi:hypothetical protein